MMGYVWGMPINGMEGLPGTVDRGERVEIVFRNTTMMSHPMHLHGHVFQVAEINGKQIQGAIRDTILVPPKATVKVIFDADNPGLWAFHCHNLYHMVAGYVLNPRLSRVCQQSGVMRDDALGTD